MAKTQIGGLFGQLEELKKENAALKAEAAATSVADGVARTIGVGGGDRERRGSMQ